MHGVKAGETQKLKPRRVGQRGDPLFVSQRDNKAGQHEKNSTMPPALRKKLIA